MWLYTGAAALRPEHNSSTVVIVVVFFLLLLLCLVGAGKPTLKVHTATSIHRLLLIQGWVVEAAGYSRPPLPKKCFSASPGGSRGVPRPDEIHRPSEFWVCPGVSSQLDVTGTPPKGLAPFDAKEQQLDSELPWMTKLLTLSLWLSPATLRRESHFGHLYPRSCSFGQHPQLVTVANCV